MSAAAAAGPVLRDIQLPPAPGWWPPAPGWWLLAALVVAVVAGLGAIGYRQWRRRSRRRRVLLELERAIEPARSDPGALAAALSRFLRRLVRIGEPAVATLAGEPWLAHLDRCAGSDEFTRGVGRVLADAPYRKTSDYDAAALIALVRRCARRVLDAERARA